MTPPVSLLDGGCSTKDAVSTDRSVTHRQGLIGTSSSMVFKSQSRYCCTDQREPILSPMRPAWTLPSGRRRNHSPTLQCLHLPARVQSQGCGRVSQLAVPLPERTGTDKGAAAAPPLRRDDQVGKEQARHTRDELLSGGQYRSATADPLPSAG